MALHQPHVVIFPFMAKGHTIPLLDLSMALSRMGLKITIITTPSNSPFIIQTISKHPHIHVAHLEFPPVEGLPKGCENTDQLPSMDLYLPFLRATTLLKWPFEQLLRKISDAHDLPICVIADFFLGPAVSACGEFDIPRLVFHGMGVFVMVACKSICVNAPHRHVTAKSEPFNVPGIPDSIQLTQADVPKMIKTNSDPLLQLMMEIGRHERETWGVVVNSYVELEGQFVDSLESFYKNRAKAWCIGPTFLYGEKESDSNQCGGTSHEYQCTITMITSEGNNKDSLSTAQKPIHPTITFIDWLNMHVASTASVIYVSFGTQTHISNPQLDEIGHGLEMCGHPFIWVIRSRSWTPPDGMEERITGRGLIIKEWAPQQHILAHPVIGGFLSHCGWNSVLESLSMGVPILAWPMIAEQHLNAKFVVEVVGAGERIRQDVVAGEGIPVGRAAICESVRDLMGGEKGRRLRERAMELSQMAKGAVHEGGSSHKGLSEMIEKLLSRAKQC